MTRSLAEDAMAAAQTLVALGVTLALTTRMAATAETRTVVAVETAHTRQQEKNLKVRLQRPKLTVAASTSARQPRARVTALVLAAETTLHSSQKLENPGQWSGFSF
jgi:hypothetical protein